VTAADYMADNLKHRKLWNTEWWG